MGTETQDTGSSYHGWFKDNKRHGEGLMKWIDGSTYQGSW